MKKLFVGSLPFSTTDSELQEMFENYGEVQSAVVIKDKFTGRSRGFGFVEMNDEDADKAMKALNGSEVSNRKIIVAEARPQEKRQERNNFRRQRAY
jgi:RNA recognition motif-containing protein